MVVRTVTRSRLGSHSQSPTSTGEHDEAQRGPEKTCGRVRRAAEGLSSPRGEEAENCSGLAVYVLAWGSERAFVVLYYRSGWQLEV